MKGNIDMTSSPSGCPSRQPRHLVRGLAVAAGMALAATGCGDDAAPAGSPETTVAVLSTEAPDPGVGPSTSGDEGVSREEPLEFATQGEALVAFEARFQCEATTRTFQDLGEVDALRLELLEAHGLSQTAYDDFVAELGADQALREQVSAALSDCFES